MPASTKRVRELERQVAGWRARDGETTRRLDGLTRRAEAATNRATALDKAAADLKARMEQAERNDTAERRVLGEHLGSLAATLGRHQALVDEGVARALRFRRDAKLAESRADRLKAELEATTRLLADAEREARVARDEITRARTAEATAVADARRATDAGAGAERSAHTARVEASAAKRREEAALQARAEAVEDANAARADADTARAEATESMQRAMTAEAKFEEEKSAARATVAALEADRQAAEDGRNQADGRAMAAEAEATAAVAAAEGAREKAAEAELRVAEAEAAAEGARAKTAATKDALDKAIEGRAEAVAEALREGERQGRVAGAAEAAAAVEANRRRTAVAAAVLAETADSPSAPDAPGARMFDTRRGIDFTLPTEGGGAEGHVPLRASGAGNWDVAPPSIGAATPSAGFCPGFRRPVISTDPAKDGSRKRPRTPAVGRPGETSIATSASSASAWASPMPSPPRARSRAVAPPAPRRASAAPRRSTSTARKRRAGAGGASRVVTTSAATPPAARAHRHDPWAFPADGTNLPRGVGADANRIADGLARGVTYGVAAPRPLPLPPTTRGTSRLAAFPGDARIAVARRPPLPGAINGAGAASTVRGGASRPGAPAAVPTRAPPDAGRSQSFPAGANPPHPGRIPPNPASRASHALAPRGPDLFAGLFGQSSPSELPSSSLEARVVTAPRLREPRRGDRYVSGHTVRVPARLAPRAWPTFA